VHFLVLWLFFQLAELPRFMDPNGRERPEVHNSTWSAIRDRDRHSREGLIQRIRFEVDGLIFQKIAYWRWSFPLLPGLAKNIALLGPHS
jgi:hypothetical protein